MSFCSRKKKRDEEVEDDEEHFRARKLQEFQESTFPNKGPSQCAFNDLDSFILEQIFSACDTPMMKVVQFVSRQWKLLAKKFHQGDVSLLAKKFDTVQFFFYMSSLLLLITC